MAGPAVSPRRPTREAILDAASERFLERGYSGVSVRDIAAAAGVDPALVIRHFGSKEGLFLEAMRVHPDRTIVFDGPLEHLGRRIVEAMLAPDDEVRSVFSALLRASDSDGVSSRLRQAHDETFVAPLRSRLTGPDADLRARLAASVVGGLLYSLWIVGDQALAAADHAAIVERYAPLLQELLTPS